MILFIYIYYMGTKVVANPHKYQYIPTRQSMCLFVGCSSHCSSLSMHLTVCTVFVLLVVKSNDIRRDVR